jgi:hypothetical protein
MSYELQFLIMVDTEIEHEELIASLKEKLVGVREEISPAKFRTFYWSGNCVQVWLNEDYDESLVSDPEDGFLYYRYKIEVFPTDGDKGVERQVNIAKQLKGVLESLGCTAVICADFEELL